MRVVLGDLSYFNQQNRRNLYVPLNIGFVGAYTKNKFKGIEVGLLKDAQALVDCVRMYKPEVVGLSSYYWNEELNKLVSAKIRAAHPECVIVLGGPCIDTDHEEQEHYFRRFPAIDATIANEGEVGFANVVEAVLGGNPWQKPIAGATFRRGAEIVRGAQIGLSTDLATVPSPYLMGLLDQFLCEPFAPMIQTSRLCPYTCSFCVSGKDRGKLRAFELDHVKAEINYIAEKYRGSRDTLLYITDENFGIMQRDLEVADYILEAKEKRGYPRSVFYYNDKRFTQISRDLHEKLGTMCWHGVCLSLQSENPETLKAIKRRNLTDEQLASALEWAKGLGLKTSTELIFGLPYETVKSFLRLLDKTAQAGFDIIHCYNLIIFDGIEMNRQRYRKEHGLKTRRRFISGSSGWVDNDLCIESEEVVVSSNSFTFEDFMLIYKISGMLQTIYIMGWMADSFKELARQGGSITDLLCAFFEPDDRGDEVSAKHEHFLKFANSLTRGLLTDEAFDMTIADIKSKVAPGTELTFSQSRGLMFGAEPWMTEMVLRAAKRVDAREERQCVPA